MFTLDECERRRLITPGPGFYALLVIGNIGFVSFVLSTTFGHDSIGGAIIHEQSTFIDQIRARQLSFPQALRIHRTLHRRHRRAIAYTSGYYDMISILYNTTELITLYEFFVTPWSHWFMVVNFLLMAVTIAVFFPANWTIVNQNQDELKILIAESADKTEFFTDEEKDSVTGAGADVEAGEGQEEHEPGELWNASERTQFLVYLNNYEMKVKCFGFTLGPEYSVQSLLFLGSAAFLLWQTTQLSKWTGFSFDRDLA